MLLLLSVQHEEGNAASHSEPYRTNQNKNNVTISSDNLQVKCVSFFVRFGLSSRLETPSPANLTNIMNIPFLLAHARLGR